MSTTELKLFKILSTKFKEVEAAEVVEEIKNLSQNDMIDRMDDKIIASESKIISTLTWRLLFFFIAQIGFTITLVKLMG